MSRSLSRAIPLVVLACAAMLAACDDAPPAPTADAADASSKTRKPAVAGLASNMVAAVSAGKTATALGVHFALGAAPAVNTPLPVEIAIVPHRDFDSIRAHFETYDGISMTAGEDLGPLSDIRTEKALKHSLMLLPAKDGVFMVTVIVETASDEGVVTRLFSIPVIVGAIATGPAKPAASGAPDTSAQKAPAAQ